MDALDPRTIAFAASLGAGLLAVMMAGYLVTHRTHPGFGLWVGSLGFITGALLLITVRDLFPVQAAETAVNLMSLGALTCVVLGVRRFVGLPARDPVLWVLMTLGVLGLLHAFLFEVPLVRSARGAAAMGLLAWWAAWVAWRHRLPRLTGQFAVLVLVLGALGSWRLWRAWFFLTSDPGYDILEHQLATVVNLAFNVLLVPMWSFAFFLVHAARTEAELEDAREAARALAERDGLTGVYNRRVLFERAALEVERARRYSHPLSLLLMDIDHFKAVNDAHGHPVGDTVLVAVAGVLRSHVREVDVVARMGGEEFALLLPETARPQALQLAERLRIVIASLATATGAGEARVTVSVGVASLMAGQDVAGLYRDADAAMYRAKAGGRDRVEPAHAQAP